MIDKKELRKKYEEIKEKGKHLNNIRTLNLSKIFENDYFQKFLENTPSNGKRIGNDENYKFLKTQFNGFLELVYKEKIMKKSKLVEKDYQRIEMFVNHSLNSFSILEGAIKSWNKGNKYLGYWIILNFYLYLYELISKYLSEAIEDLGNFAKNYNKDIKEKVKNRKKLTLYDFLISVGELDKLKSTSFKKTFEKYIDYALRNDIAHLNYVIKEEKVIIGKRNKKTKEISFFINKVYDLILFLFVLLGSNYGIFSKLKSKIESEPEVKKKFRKVLDGLKE